jgi:D-alanyl-D-alanine carboxypeptidase/D-alanyl-D-alanine-endopeptidase (penicillin-binding protein 4)
MKNYSAYYFITGYLFLQACNPSHFLAQKANRQLLQQKDLLRAHIGISIYDPSKARYLYNHQADKYFVPASNTKLFSLYAGMKILGDSLVGIRYIERTDAVLLFPSGDPTLLHPDYPKQPVIDFLKSIEKKIYIAGTAWQEEAFGSGWSWDDYNDPYMVERSPLPIYGNLIRWVQEKQGQEKQDLQLDPSPTIYSVPEVDWKVRFSADTTAKRFFVKRKKDENIFEITEGDEKYKFQDVPFVTYGLASGLQLLKDTVGKEFNLLSVGSVMTTAIGIPGIIYTQPSDSLYRPMMFRSDNFFAEQTLLMASNERIGVMNDKRMIDTLLHTSLKDLPQTPVWVDGSGLSRYNLFTPMDFIWLLNKMRIEFGMERMKAILPTGGSGTLSTYYKQDSGYIYAKTGSLSGVIALSGYLVTQQKRLLLFSVLVNNFKGNPGDVRRAVAGFLHDLRTSE